MTRIVCISDTHMMHDAVDVPDGDVLIHAGDSLSAGTQGVIVVNASICNEDYEPVNAPIVMDL